jgi:hypothetical protein
MATAQAPIAAGTVKGQIVYIQAKFTATAGIKSHA